MSSPRFSWYLRHLEGVSRVPVTHSAKQYKPSSVVVRLCDPPTISVLCQTKSNIYLCMFLPCGQRPRPVGLVFLISVLFLFVFFYPDNGYKQYCQSRLDLVSLHLATKRLINSPLMLDFILNDCPGLTANKKDFFDIVNLDLQEPIRQVS